MAEDIENEFGVERRLRLESILGKPKLAALEVALDTASSGMTRDARARMKGVALDDLLRTLRDSTAVRNERLKEADAVVGRHIAHKNSALSDWLQQEEDILDRVRRGGCGIGQLQAEHLADRTHVQIMEAMMEGKVPLPTISQTLSFCVVEVSEGRAVLQSRPSPDYVNPMQTMHGGWMTTLLDSAMGTAVFTTLQPGFSYMTSDISANFLAGLPVTTERVRIAASTVGQNERTASVRAWLYGPDLKVYAEGRANFRTFPVD